MKFVEAFDALGYKLSNHQTDWSAEGERGVCITIWKEETGTMDGLLYFDSKKHAGPIEIWGGKVGNSKRTKHLNRAKTDFAGLVDVVILHGTPGKSYDVADPWFVEKRGGRWRIQYLDEESGHFCVRVERNPTKS
jgi:hypothetical protein